MTDKTSVMPDPGAILQALIDAPRQLFAQFLPDGSPSGEGDLGQWASVAQRIQALWIEFVQERMDNPQQQGAAIMAGLADFAGIMRGWLKTLPLSETETQQKAWSEALGLWQGVLGRMGIALPGTTQDPAELPLPRKDRRFADPRWGEQPLFALLHQTYLLLAEQALALAERTAGGNPAQSEQLKFAVKTLAEMLSPANFVLTNPVVLEKTLSTRGENLVKGMEHLLADLRQGQLTHVDPKAFTLGKNIAVTPGKVVHQTPLFQLIQYKPSTPDVYETPLIIFPPWINRFYILDLSPEKSFIKWAVDQGLTVYVVSWKSADSTMADVVWDDYIRAQIEAIDTVRDRLNVPAVHTIGYCVAGTTLAATLAILARRGEADKVRSATFFTAQVDFERAGELKIFIDDQQLAALEKLSAGSGYLDGRFMAATFNLLRGNDLIWNYVVKNYLLGEDYPAFDLLHWNGDVTNLPARWHMDYLRDLYRDNRLVVPDSLSADGTPIDLTRIETPTYVQAGREDHIAPAASVWRLMHHLRGPRTFLLAGSGHIAGVVNPPAARKYQYWTNPDEAESLEDFVAGATETPGSWWPHWIGWIDALAPQKVPAKGKRQPGGKGNKAIEDAPGSYVKSR